MSKAADAKGEALLCVQQMRNIVVASTLMVMGMSQLLGRMYNTMLTWVAGVGAMHAVTLALAAPPTLPRCPQCPRPPMPSPQNQQAINQIFQADPLAGPSTGWGPAYLKVAVPLGAGLLGTLAFGQAVRLGVHIGFSVRVQV